MHGITGTGKSFFVDQVILKPLKKEDEVFEIESKHLDALHAFASWDKHLHKAGIYSLIKLIWHSNFFKKNFNNFYTTQVRMDEFNLGDVDVDKFKMMAGAEPFQAQVKFQNTPVYVRLEVPQFYLSNIPIRRGDVEEAVWARVNVVNTSRGLEYKAGFVSGGYDDKTCPAEYSDLWSWNEEKVLN